MRAVSLSKCLGSRGQCALRLSLLLPAPCSRAIFVCVAAGAWGPTRVLVRYCRYRTTGAGGMEMVREVANHKRGFGIRTTVERYRRKMNK